ncbi:MULTISPECIES: hypothetical protein [unclassified Pseudoalteromonas]|uniref:hypothetical protein n=1 Tax=unclassified Pseudoalteromonas TaxID=194690 RepID=UPI002359444C|nr:MULTISPECIES: hypothetical protein [unclassified Pseudoalteromonas]MDC9563454.1 hypothetical protein [Pseudoalteromonas sp. GAB2316C]MDC9572064.1 hypothetical protein [Pseudoalteromonas sp. GABNS16A]MDC9583901.1 hypothetical protein [Pseudoalteromonas sp. GABNS16C]MDC9607830.1 hypothetical protein [Pseudoalteromonas sp. GABNS16H]
MSDSVLTGRSVHRHLIPHFDLKSKNPIAKMLMTHIEKHNFQRNPYLNKMRYAGGVVNLGYSQKILPARTNRLRIEREQTLRETMKALVYCANYKLNSESLFEIKMSVKSLAKQINQLHVSEPTKKYRHGRDNYNPVLNALKDLAAAGLVMLQQNYCVKLKRYQSMRIFITPELFSSLGVNKKTIKKLIHSQHKHDVKSGYDVNKENKAQHLRALVSASIQENDSHALKALKARIKNEFNLPGDIKDIKKKLASLIKNQKSDNAQTEAPEKPQLSAEQQFNRLVVNLNVPAFSIFEIEERVREQHPALDKGSPPYYEAMIKLVKDFHQ